MKENEPFEAQMYLSSAQLYLSGPNRNISDASGLLVLLPGCINTASLSFGEMFFITAAEGH